MLLLKLTLIGLIAHFRTVRSDCTDDIDGLKEEYEEARKYIDDLLSKLNVCESKQLAYSKELGNRTKTQTGGAGDVIKIVQLTQQLAAAKSELAAIKESCPHKECDENDSDCKLIPGMGCYCIHAANHGQVISQSLTTMDRAESICAGLDMKLVAIETLEEWKALSSLLIERLQFSDAFAENFITSGVYELDQWKWRSSGSPFLFKFWTASVRNNPDTRQLAVIKKNEPFKWTATNNLTEHFHICERTAYQQKARNVQTLALSQKCDLSIHGPGMCAYLDQLGCYCIVLLEATLSEAIEKCAKHDMTLLSVETKDEWDQVSAFLWEKKPDYDYNSYFWTSGRYTQKSKQWAWTGSGKPAQNINFVRWDPEGPKKDTQKDYAIFITNYGHEWISAAIDPQWTSHYICEKAIDPTLFPK